MNTLKIFPILFLFGSLIMFSTCNNDDPEIPNEEELITTLNYYLTPNSGGDVITLSFQDLDGDGGNAPVFTTDPLSANTTYSGRLELLNEAESPSENITDEINEEKEEHQFFFSSSLSDLDISYADSDANGNPVGITSDLITGTTGNGTITIVLKHEPDKSGTGVADGDISNAGGETDIEVTFNIEVQ